MTPGAQRTDDGRSAAPGDPGLGGAGGDAPAVRRVARVGDRAVIADVAGTAAAAALARSCGQHPLPGQVDVVAGATTVVVTLDRPVDVPAATRHLRSLVTTEEPDDPGTEHVIDVVYDGQDLAEVADLTSLSTDGVVAAHTGSPWTAAFAGFAPGFAYLSGGDPRLRVPRRASARTDVPAGSVALAGGFSGVYPRASPGGWQLVGRTASVMWDLGRAPPSLLQVGDAVVFRAVRELVAVPRPAVALEAPTAAEGPALVVLAPGAASTVQDAGRPGLAGLGVPTSGAMDAAALRSANRTVGNDPGAAVVEVVGGGVRLSARGDAVVVVTGAPVTVLQGAAGTTSPAGGRDRALGRPFALRDGDVLHLGAPTGRLWSYVAVRGGLDVPRVLGSRSTDVLSGLGPPALVSGDVLAVGRAVRGAVEVPWPGVATAEDGGGQHGAPDEGVVDLEVVLGPREDWFTPAAVERLLSAQWVVTPRSNRVGLRLHGPPLERAVLEELPSEGVATGSLQVPPGGQPVLFTADHPVTGGYPTIAVVTSRDLGRAAGVAPGARLRFRRSSP